MRSDSIVPVLCTSILHTNWYKSFESPYTRCSKKRFLARFYWDTLYFKFNCLLNEALHSTIYKSSNRKENYSWWRKSRPLIKVESMFRQLNKQYCFDKNKSKSTDCDWSSNSGIYIGMSVISSPDGTILRQTRSCSALKDTTPLLHCYSHTPGQDSNFVITFWLDS